MNATKSAINNRALSYIEQHWQHMIRSVPHDTDTLIGLPHPFPIPRDGGASNAGMFQEMYYWDSFFISLGLFDTPHEHLIVDVAENFAYLVERFGIIPNGTRFYFLSRSQPPFFTQQIKLALRLSEHQFNQSKHSWLERMLDSAEREHVNVWLGDAQPHHRRVYCGLSRYFDINYLDILASCESGWDHSTRCDDRWLDHLPVDLNCILYQRECDMAEFASQLGDSVRAQKWQSAAEQRRNTIQKLMWDDARGFYFDFDWRAERINPDASLAGFYAMWAGVATHAQAVRMTADWLPQFLCSGGLVSTLKREAGKQWASPNGWAPLQWIVTEGLQRYGFLNESQEVRRRWLNTCAHAFEATGKFFEKYSVMQTEHDAEEGVYGQLTGFGWTNGVYVDFCHKLTTNN